MKKKLIAGVLAASMCLAAASCSAPDFVDSTVIDPAKLTTTEAPIPETTTSSVPSETSAPTETTTSVTPEVPVTAETVKDLESVLVGKHITFVYNAASADVEWEVKKGVGSRELVTFTVTLKDGYLFDGFSKDDAIVNGKTAVSKELTYTLDTSSATKLFLNTGMQIVYHANGGEIAKAGFNGTDIFSAVFYQNPNTLPAQGYFKRDGYTLTGYNTEADGSGEDVSLGSKVTGGKGKIDVYCIWEKNNAESDFEVKTAGSGVYITAYKGTETNVVIPETIGGKKVGGIASGAFEKTAITRVVVPSTVKEIEDYAFYKCEALDTVVLYDTVQKIGDDTFANCDALKNVRLNTTRLLINDWFASTSAKIDRLMWAKDKKKIIIIGGSGSLYGFDSSVIDEALGGEYEIINFGENANVTSIVYFDIVEDFVQEGDIVLWCPEPGSYTLGAPMCSNRFWEFRKSNYDFTKYINPQYYQNLFSSFASFSASLSARKYQEYDMLSKAMNKYGDDVSNRDSKGLEHKNPYNFGYSMLGGDAITELVENMTDKGASVYFSYAAMKESMMKITSENDVLAYEELVTSVPGITAISDYRDCIFADKYFYDSEWHLTDEGAKARAEQVAKDLLKALGKS